MREILFRGKRVDNGEWVFGDLIREPWGYCIQVVTGGGNNYSRKKYTITQETVGQFTGLTDKNGKRIFEGDIVNQNRNGFETLYVTIFTDEDVGSCGCCYPSFDGIGFVFESVKGIRAYAFDMYPLEAVGNIHDNKEMLKVGGGYAKEKED